jgi:membrane-associated phospholipid phosphatase
MDQRIVPFWTLLHNFGKNTLHCFSWRFGIYWIAPVIVTVIFVIGGLDWRWMQFVYGIRPLAAVGLVADMLGIIGTEAVPLIGYIVARLLKSRKGQVLALAMGQAAIIATVSTAIIKVFTGRRQAGVYNLQGDTIDYSADFRFGFMRGGFVDGWPSGHMNNAVAFIAVINEICPEKKWVKLAAYIYALIIGVGMTFCDHWWSDIIAGASMGYAIGKTVGRNFKPLLEPSA